MEDYINSRFFKSLQPLSEVDCDRYSFLLEKEKGIEVFQVSHEGIYLEYNTYIYSKQQIGRFLTDSGFIISEDQKPGFIRRQIQLLANSNSKYYGNRKPDCC